MHSIIHDAYYHELHKLSNDITVLVFSGLTSFVRMVLQREENKGVEFTVYPRNGLRAPGGGGQVTVALIKSKSALLMDWSGQVRNDCWSGTNSKTRIYEAGDGVNSWFCADGCDGVREDVAARVLA